MQQMNSYAGLCIPCGCYVSPTGTKLRDVDHVLDSAGDYAQNTTGLTVLVEYKFGTVALNSRSMFMSTYELIGVGILRAMSYFIESETEG